MVIRASDRVGRLLEKDERLLEVFAEASPHFERLRDPRMRKVMAGLVTVAAAARIAGIDEADLVRRLNAAAREWRTEGEGEQGAGANGGAVGVAGEGTRDGGADGATNGPRADAPGKLGGDPPGKLGGDAPANLGGDAPANLGGDAPDRIPPFLAALGPDRIVDLDVREDLRNGMEPFSRIMDARRSLAPGQVLRLRAIFEPAPLYHVLGKQGFRYWTERLADDDWRVWFYRDDPGAAPEPDAAGTGDVAGGEGSGIPAGAVVIDVRDLEPPEPMVRTLEALESLPAGATLVQVNVRIPQFLLPRLEERGFTYEVHERSRDLVHVFIRRRDER